MRKTCRRCPYILIGVSASLLLAGAAYAQNNVLQPTDPIFASSPNNPGSEGVKNAIDGTSSKYLNFDSKATPFLPSGFAITPQVGPTWVTGVAMQSANDAPERDPMTVTIEGSNDTITNYTDGTWEMIATVQVPAYTARFQWQKFTFSNFKPYKSYRWVVTACQGPNQNSMQIAEVQLLGIAVPKNLLQPTDTIIASSPNNPGSEGVKNAIDGTSSKYLNFDSKASPFLPSGFAVTPAVGATVAQGVAIQSANDAPERDPKTMTLEGSNDDVASYSGTWSPITTIQVPAFTARFQWQTFLFANVTPYKHYRWTVTECQGPNQNSMQIAEVEILGTSAPKNILLPTDAIVASSPNNPGSEGVKNAIDGTSSKYLNFDSKASPFLPSGFAVTPAVGETTITALGMQSANDAPERDPLEVRVDGSNDDVADYTTGTWTPIVTITNIPAWPARFAWQYFYFPNSTAYKHYKWTVLACQGPNQNSMQIAEVQLLAITASADCSKAAFVSTPSDTPVLNGQPAELFVTVNGPWPLQWLADGVPVPGANQPAFTTPAITAANADVAYSVAIVGCQTSPPVKAVIFTPSSTRSVGIDFWGSGANGAGPQGLPRSLIDQTLIGGVQAQAYWNVISNSAGTTGSTGDQITQGDYLFDSNGNGLTNADGTASMTFEFSTSGAWGAGTGNTTPTERLLNGVAGANNVADGEQTLIFHNVPQGSHAVLLYSISPPLQFQNVKFAITNKNLVVYQRNLEAGEYLLAPGYYRSTSTNPNAPSIGNFVRFDGVQPDANGDIVITYNILTDADRETGVNALQLLLNAPNPGDPPVITQQPVQTVAPSNGVAMISVGATGNNLTYQWRKNGQTIFNAGHISGATSPTLMISSFGPEDEGVYSVAIFNPAGSTISKNASLAISDYNILDDLVGYWKFNETGTATVAANSATGGKPATIAAPAWGAGLVGNALTLDGFSTFGVVSNYSVASKAMAGSAWLKVPTGTTPGTDATIFRNMEGNFAFGGTADRILGQFDLDLVFDVNTGVWSPSATIGLGNNYARVTSPTPFPMGGWVHLAFSADGAQLTLYTNGAVAAAIDYTGNINAPTVPYIYIGGRGILDTNLTPADFALDASNPNTLPGQLDELALWKRALTPEEVMALYNAGKANKELTTIVLEPPVGQPTMTVTRQGGNITVSWDGGTLQTAPSANGPWTDQPSAANPLTEPANDTAKFYRAKR